MNKKMTKATNRMMALLIAMTLAISMPGFSNLGNIAVYAATATNGIVKGPNTPDAEASITTTLDSGESVSLKIVNSILTIKVDAADYTFQIGNITKTTDAAVVNEKDGLLHILTLGGVYYVFDLYTGVQIIAYRNINNGKYCCSSRNSNGYMVYGKSLINNLYFYELLTSNSVSRERLMTRGEFDIIINGGDPSLDDQPTQQPTEKPTVAPTEKPTVAPTEQSTAAPTEQPTAAPTEKPTVASTEQPTAAPTEKPTVAPTERPTSTPTEVPTKVISGNFDFEFWWNQFIKGTITWEQFTDVMWKYQWTANSETTEKSTTYYFYDENGKLIRTETITISNNNQSGTGSGSGNIHNSGKADIDINGKGNGGGSGNITINVNGNGKGSNSTSNKPTISVKRLTLYIGQKKTLTLKNANGKVGWRRGNKRISLGKPYGNNSYKIKVKGLKAGKVTVTATCKGKTYKCIVTVKKKAHARVITSGSRIKLFTEKNKIHGCLLFNPKTGVMNWNGYTVNNVKTCGFIQGSWNVIFVTNNGKVYKLPKRAKKGKSMHKTRINCEKAITLNRDTYGFVKYIKITCGGIKNVSGK